MPGNGNRGARGIHYVYSPRKGRSQEESLEHLERWEPCPIDPTKLCKLCYTHFAEKLDEFSILTTYRCANNHRLYELPGN